MRACDPMLAAILADGSVRLQSADVYDVVLVDSTTFFWTTYDRDLTWNGNTYVSQSPFMSRSKWSVKNTMEIPELEIILRAGASAFNGSIDLMSLVHNGMFDGATITMNRLYMPSATPTDTSLGSILIFGGEVSTVDLEGSKITFTVRGANNKLGQYAPRNVWQVGCIHAFCDSGCTLLRASFTSSFTVGASPTRSFVPWTSAPGTPALFQLGTLTMTSGPSAGEERTIMFADATGVSLVYPLAQAPSPGDTFDAFQGCDKTQTICTARGNIQNWRGFPFIPPATTAI